MYFVVVFVSWRINDDDDVLGGHTSAVPIEKTGIDVWHSVSFTPDEPRTKDSTHSSTFWRKYI